MLSTEEAAAAVAEKPFPKVTRAAIDAKIAGKEFFFSGTLTIAVVTLQNGFKVVGTAAAADSRNFDPAIGERIAYDDAVRQIWPLEGYLLRERIAAGVVT